MDYIPTRTAHGADTEALCISAGESYWKIGVTGQARNREFPVRRGFSEDETEDRVREFWALRNGRGLTENQYLAKGPG